MIVAPRNTPAPCCDDKARCLEKGKVAQCGICLSIDQNAPAPTKNPPKNPHTESRPLKSDPTTKWMPTVEKKSVATCKPTTIKNKEQQKQSKALVSCLRTCSSKEVHYPSRRRVRGLWNATCSCLFSSLHDDVLLFTMSYLSMKDLLSASMVCRRWKHCALHQSSWKQVDATDFVQAAHDHYHTKTQCEPRDATSQALQKYLEPRKLRSLAVRSIEHRLSANVFLPAMKDLVELTLTGYADLTDTHVQVMFVPSSQVAKGNNLRKLALEQCPLLTNATVQYISRHCANLQDLSLRGNTNIADLVPLRWHEVAKPKTVSLQSLFIAPTTTTIVPSTAAPAAGGSLRRLNVVRTGVTATAMVTSLRTARGKVRLERLSMDGDTWNDARLQEFATLIALADLECLEIGCADRFTGSTDITDTGLLALQGPLLGLRCINLAGHRTTTAPGIAQLLLSAPKVEDVNLEGCQGVVSVTSSDAGVFALTSALSRLATLKQLVLCRCFLNRKQSVADPRTFAREEELGRMLLKALCKSSHHLKELDVTGCYFVTQADVAMLRKSCPGLLGTRAIRASGTRYSAHARGE